MSKQIEAQTELAVSGMTCGSCSSRVERTLSAELGVSAVRVDLPGARAWVVYDATATAPDLLAAAVTTAGYPATVSQNAVPVLNSATQCSCCARD